MTVRSGFAYAATLAALLAASHAAARGASKLVYPGRDGRLVYMAANVQGDRIPDFSNCGYMGGGVRIPDVRTRATLEPVKGDGDDTERIQAAIDRVAGVPPDADGFRGAVLLRRGTYRVAGTLRIRSSGVVLRGEGQHEDGTVIRATGKAKRTLIEMLGTGGQAESRNTRRRIADAYVPVGARAVTVESAEGFTAGDRVIVWRPSTKEWIHAIGMDRLPKGKTQWAPGRYDLRYERTVSGVRGNVLTLDAPVVNSMDERYGGGFVYRYTWDGRLARVGVEDLRLVSEYETGREDSDEQHAWNGVTLDRVEHAWVRRVTAVHFGFSAVSVGRRAARVTVEDCAFLDPVSKVTGSRRYSFALKGQLTLVQRCYARNGRHDFVMHDRVCGPNVFLDCVAERCRNDSGPHHRWATGTLYDNVACQDLNVQDRQGSGSGHGWAGSQMVFWNCLARRGIICQKPPTSQNYAIGCKGQKRPGWHERPDGYWESRGRHVWPRSLYLKQLEERLGRAALLNVATPAQLKGTVYEDVRSRLAR